MSLADNPQERIEDARHLMLAALPVPRAHVQWLAENTDKPTSTRLHRALGYGTRLLALEIHEREQILRALEDCPEPLTQLRATLLQEHTWRRREGL